MKCLALNTAGKVLSIALTDDDKILNLYSAPERKDQGNNIISTINQLLENCKLAYDDLDAVAAVTGPGSFTGIRIGVAAARGIAMFPKKPVIGVTAFELYALKDKTLPNIIVIESWREELYFAVQNSKGENLCQPLNLKPQELADFVKSQNWGDEFIITGDANEALKPFFTKSRFVTEDKTAADVSRLAVEKLNSGNNRDKPKPYYLRPADITISSKVQRAIG